MLDGRKQSRLAKRRYQQKPKRAKILALFLTLAASLVFIFLLAKPRFWNGKTRLSLVINQEDGDALLVVFDPVLRSITMINVPQKTQMIASRNLGEWPLESIWKLGEQEKVGGGTLLAETITKTFKFPTEAWAGEGATGLVSENTLEIVKSIFSLYSTNLGLADRIGLGLFSFQIKPSRTQEVDLVKVGLLEKTRLVDGEIGYKIKRSASPMVAGIFADTAVSQEALRVGIVNQTGSKARANEVGEIIEVLGAKLVAIQFEKEQDFDCEVVGSQSLTATKITDIFSCQRLKKDSEIFDVEVRLGKKFLKHF
jgi:hypothetical protein